MKKLFMLFAMLVSVAGLCAYGGSGGRAATPDATSTPVGTTVNLTAFKSVLMGSSTGSQYSFPYLAGKDTQGRAWSGSYSLIADGATTFEAQNVTKNRSLTTLKLGSGTPVSTVSTKYFQVADGSSYKFVDSSGLISVSVSQFVIPATPKVGDFGTIGTFNNTDGTTFTVTWSLNADVNGASQLVISSVVRSGSTVTATETDTYLLDATGNPTKFSVSVTISGVIVNLSGNRV